MTTSPKDEPKSSSHIPTSISSKLEDQQDGTSLISSKWVDRWYAWYEEHGSQCFGLSGVPTTTEQANEQDSVPPGPNVNTGPVVAGKFQCTFCGKGFARRHRLEACENQHRGQRPYVCEGSCGQQDCVTAFTSQANLARHLRAEQERYKTCECCEMKVLRQNYAKHRSACSS